MYKIICNYTHVSVYIYIYTCIYIYKKRLQRLQECLHASQVRIGLRHVFSAELDDGKRNYLLKAFPKVEHMYGDVKCFAEKQGHCFKCGRDHTISRLNPPMHIDLLISGPSCKDLSPWAVEEQSCSFY